MNNKYRVAVVGASGLVGSTIMKVLEERAFPVETMTLFASKRSAGSVRIFAGKEVVVRELTEESFQERFDIVFFAAGGDVSRRFVPMAVESGAVVIDNSSVFRMDDEVPLVVPEVNPEAIGESRLIANPNCSTIQCMPVLKAIKDAYGLKRVVYNSYQAVSGSGLAGLRDLDEGLQEFYPRKIKGNVIPHIDSFLDSGYTKEEMKMIRETQKILNDEALGVTATTVRVPVRFAHCVSINAELGHPFSMEELREVLAKYPGIVVMDDPSHQLYPIPEDAEGKDEIFVGRIRRDGSLPSAVNLWVVADNVRKGAATNAVQIAEAIIRRRQ
ncbi:MAG: aspartate-semialdehyde dehydrogenase [Christensenellales bacterium]|jgi:aspartate-semialdehyde dehydrogenase